MLGNVYTISNIHDSCAWWTFNVPTVEEETEAQRPRHSFQEVAWRISPHPTPTVLEGVFFIGLRMFPQSCAKCYVKVQLPDSSM